MLENHSPELEMEQLQEKIEKELEKIQKLDVPSVKDVNDPYGWSIISETLQTAGENVNAGVEGIPIGHYRGLKKIVALILAKIGHIVGWGMTTSQRRFNNAMLHSLHIILDGIREMNVKNAHRNAVLESQLAEKSALVNYLKTNFILQERRVSTLLEEIERQRKTGQEISVDVLLERKTPDPLDAVYLSFENRFRGTREEIIERLRVYLPKIRNAGAGSADRPVLDIGCGRGEWLQVLSEEKLSGKGIDLNPAQVKESVSLGLDVEEREALEYLRSLPDSSVGAITSFQLVEHLDFATRVALFDECNRVLKSGGVAIFETPNPANLLVGSCNFWSDPTHIRPLFPQTHQFVMELRGFVDVELLFLHPHDEQDRLPEHEAPKLASRLNDLFSCARDYAVIGYKP